MDTVFGVKYDGGGEFLSRLAFLFGMHRAHTCVPAVALQTVSSARCIFVQYAVMLGFQPVDVVCAPYQ